MKILKISLLVIAAILVMFGAFIFFHVKSILSVAKLDISDANTPAQYVERVDEWLTGLQRSSKFNGVVLMIVGGDVHLEKGYGFTNYTLKTPLTPQSSMRLASVSKQFTAAGIMILHDQGKLNLDDAVSRHISNFPYEGVTIRHLLNQTSGIPDNYMALAEPLLSDGEYLTIKQTAALVIKENAPALSLPNEQYDYSNTNYVLLAHIAELISDQSFEDFMHAEVFQPLGMKNTRIWNALSPDQTFPNQTQGFSFNASKAPAAVSLSIFDGVAGDGAVFSAIEDFKIWNNFWSENTLITPETLAQAFTAPILNSGKTSDYGFGWLVTPNGHWHNGSWLATNSFIARNAQTQSLLVVIDNSDSRNFNAIITHLTLAIRKMK